MALLLAPRALAEPSAGAHGAGVSSCPELAGDAVSDAERLNAAFARYQCLFEREQYDACLPIIEQACPFMAPERCSYNRATVHYALGHCEAALEHYRAYLDQAPYDEGRESALTVLAELRARCGTRADAVSPGGAVTRDAALASIRTPTSTASALSIVPALSSDAVASSEFAATSDSAAASGAALDASDTRASAWASSKSSPPPPRTVPYVLLGAGAALAIASSLFALQGRRTDAEFETRLRRRGPYRDPEFDTLDANGDLYNALAWVTLGGSIAAFGVGGTLLVLGAPGDGAASVRFSAGPSVSYQGAF